MADLVASGENEGVSVSQFLDAVVVEMALIAPLRLVNKIVGLVPQKLL